MMSYVNRLKSNDLQECLECLKEISEKRIHVDENLVTAVGMMLKNASNLRSIPMNLAENVLFAVGKTMENDEEAGVIKFSESALFIDSIVQIIADFGVRIKNSLKTHRPFGSHYCYELCVYIVVAMVETSSLLKIFLKTISSDNLSRLFEALCAVLVRDFLYVTQVNHP